MSQDRISGIIAAPFLPTKTDRTIDFDRIGPYGEMLQANGVQTVMINGASGSGLSLSASQRRSVTSCWIKNTNCRVLVQVGALALDDAINLAADAQAQGAKAIVAMPPLYPKPRSLTALANWLVQIAKAAPDLPFYYYHYPDMTEVRYRLVEILEPASEQIPTLAGAKFSFADTTELNDPSLSRFSILLGDDKTFGDVAATNVASRVLPVDGYIGSTFNFMVPLHRKLQEFIQTGDQEKAKTYNLMLKGAVEAFRKSWKHPLTAQRCIMRMIGFDCGPVPAPLSEFNEEELSDFMESLEWQREAGLWNEVPR